MTNETMGDSGLKEVAAKLDRIQQMLGKVVEDYRTVNPIISSEATGLLNTAMQTSAEGQADLNSVTLLERKVLSFLARVEDEEAKLMKKGNSLSANK